MHLDHCVPFLFRHVDHHAVPQNAGVVDQDVETPERRDPVIDQRLRAGPVADIVAVHDGFAAGLPDRFDDRLGGRQIGALASRGSAEIVDDDFCALLGQHQRVFTPEAAARTRNDGDTSRTQISHFALLDDGFHETGINEASEHGTGRMLVDSLFQKI
jgi:hypothetical protein